MITLNITGTVWREMVWNQKRFMSPDFVQKKIRNWLVTEALRWTFPVSPNHVHKEEIFVPQLELNYKNTYFHFSASMSTLINLNISRCDCIPLLFHYFFNKHHWFFFYVCGLGTMSSLLKGDSFYFPVPEWNQSLRNFSRWKTIRE